MEELSTDALRTLLSDLRSNGLADKVRINNNESPERDDDMSKKNDLGSGDKALFERNLEMDGSKVS